MIFFICPNCKKIWQHPIDKCPECFLALERTRSKEVKVKVVSRVNIPSIYCPKTPYWVLVLEDEDGKKWIQKSENEYKVGEKIFYESKKSADAVAIWRVKYDLQNAIEKIFELLGGITVEKGTKVLILPTLIEPTHSYFRDNTSPEFLEATLKILFLLGIRAENIKVAAQSFDETSIGLKAQRTGLLDVCQKHRILPVDLATGNFIKKGDIEISEEVFKTDLILNLPILKIGQAAATTNIFFLLKKNNFLAQKYLFSEKEILEKIKKEIPKILTIAEARHVQDEKGFTNYTFLCLGSFSFQNLDRVFFEIVNKKELPEFLKDVELDKIEIVGRKINEVEFYC